MGMAGGMRRREMTGEGDEDEDGGGEWGTFDRGRLMFMERGW